MAGGFDTGFDDGFGGAAPPPPPTPEAGVIIQPNGPLALDSYLDEADSAARHGFKDEMKFGAEIAVSATHAVLEIPLRAIPAGAVINTGTQLELVVGTSPSGTMSNAVCERLNRRGWDQPTVTWDEFMEDAPWTTPGGDVAIATPLEATFTVPTSGDITISGSAFEALVQDALDNRGGILSILLRGADAETDTVSIRSGQYRDRSKTPKLTVVTTVASEANLGHIYKGGKRALSSWVTAGNKPISEAKFIAIGVGLSTDPESRRRLRNEIFRVPIAGSTLDLDKRRVDIWGSFPAGKGTADSSVPLTEVGLFAGKSIVEMENFDTLTGWSVDVGSLSLDATTHREGNAALIWAGITAGGNRTLTKSGLAIDLSGTSLDDFICFHFNGDNSIQSDFATSALKLTDENGVWSWPLGVIGIVWVPEQLPINSFTSKPAGATGLGIVNKIEIQVFPPSGTLEARIDHMRVMRGEDDILAVAPLDNLVKAVGDTKKYAIRLAAARSTDG